MFLELGLMCTAHSKIKIELKNVHYTCVNAVLAMMEDAWSATSVGGHLCSMVRLGAVIAGGDAKKFKRLNSSKFPFR